MMACQRRAVMMSSTLRVDEQYSASVARRVLCNAMAYVTVYVELGVDGDKVEMGALRNNEIRDQADTSSRIVAVIFSTCRESKLLREVTGYVAARGFVKQTVWNHGKAPTAAAPKRARDARAEFTRTCSSARGALGYRPDSVWKPTDAQTIIFRQCASSVVVDPEQDEESTKATSASAL
ncbi:non-catalytic subunit of N-terminal acetyltransferase [Pseudozyma hubeiensis SY62]|uniref:Non-catalytic subunit of N-terminal acetyltransferase n=1 Tax=Pseudozyma hubeiensis (strain SY62) TaxID=1305764 RepID=R9P5U8_PSEHS|nr:non-catalytic subunit of N-terminal acetyltransferase [Pseudozyma hubeiensis SY62]GAC96704.1 non-catalytic subunit of N-terminal acetyltransferase [Pseudozyma hubeiensis SY62]